MAAMAQHEKYDAVICLAGGLDDEERLPPKVVARMDAALSLIEAGASENLVVTGGWSFMLTRRPERTEAEAMVEYAVARGISRSAIFPEDKSHDTISSAYFTKVEVVKPREWLNLALVTSRSHTKRSMRIFGHVFGDGYTIKGFSAPETRTIKTAAYEFAGGVLLDQVLKGTAPGDDEAIGERIREMLPGYGDATLQHLLLGSAKGVLLPCASMRDYLRSLGSA